MDATQNRTIKEILGDIVINFFQSIADMGKAYPSSGISSEQLKAIGLDTGASNTHAAIGGLVKAAVTFKLPEKEVLRRATQNEEIGPQHASRVSRFIRELKEAQTRQ